MELNLKELAEKIHENSKSKGFYDNKDHIFFEYAQVFEIIKEVAEFHEAYKKGKDGAGDWYLEHPEEVGQSPVFLACIKDTWQDELADIIIRLLDYAAFVGFELLQYQPTEIGFELLQYQPTEKGQVLDNYELGNYCLDWVLKLTDMAYEKANWYMTESIYYVLDFAIMLNCNLEWHIQAKIAYNATRERLHGKKF
jgi:NTP pyrophosphatase (non-canonical NTP hydrolase)